MPTLRVPRLRAPAILLAAAIAGHGGAAAAAPASASKGPAVAEAAPDDPLADAQRLYDRGRAKFETADYSAAIELWTEAYASVPDSPEGAQIKVLLIYNLATARSKQFEVSRDPAELRQAAILLRNFEQRIPALYAEGEEAEAERARVREKLAELDRLLAEHEAAQEDGDEDETEAEPAQAEPTPEDLPAPEPARPSRGLVIGGAVMAGLGVGGLGLMAAGLGIGARANDISGLEPTDIDGRRAQFDRGRTGNALAVVGVAVGTPLLVAGAVMLAVGLRRARAGGMALVPGLAPMRGGTALVLQGRF